MTEVIPKLEAMLAKALERAVNDDENYHPAARRSHLAEAETIVRVLEYLENRERSS